ncbi:hypothetical protein HAP47_0034385 [Bradyrhizobium sp. 41S5]|uniref:hypothetical protein n=1 Tax=Bradyrhizobium sp. 41S5 TaxID=1404443 RepID=UPI00156B202C|nr:hypothetical protein [Bradyrhizobium sp. 41S5]UFX44193.1 hypothetical protein HAP47_0034385 [Bradyrhizobium sp. 41S5]
MAKKNEILLSIALEGDAEVKAKLEAIGDAGKKSLGDIQKKLAMPVRHSARRPKAGGGGLKEAVAPLLEKSGLQGAFATPGAFAGVARGASLSAAKRL